LLGGQGVGRKDADAVGEKKKVDMAALKWNSILPRTGKQKQDP